MTHEEKLKAVIEAQVKGGCTNWEWWIPGDTPDHQDGTLREEIYDIGLDKAHILQILLDTHGMKAAYGEEEYHHTTSLLDRTFQKDGHYAEGKMAYYMYVTLVVTGAWHKGNDWKGAIDTAYDLLLIP